MSRLEVAFDDVTIDQSLDILKTSADLIDIIEVGTLFIIKYGLEPIRRIRELYPDKTILADPKIMDAAPLIAKYCFEAGADIVTVMGVSSEATIKKVISTAAEYNKKVFIDLLDVKDAAGRIAYFDSLGADILCLHSSKEDSSVPFGDLETVRKISVRSDIAIAGGIDTSTVGSVMKYDPDIVIVGSGVYRAKDPAAVIRSFKEQM